jgi:hypothetical protein
MQDREVNIENTAALPRFDGDLRVAFIRLESRSEKDVRHEMAQKKKEMTNLKLHGFCEWDVCVLGIQHRKSENKIMTHEPEEIFCLRTQVHHSIFHRAADITKTTSSKFGGSLQNKNEWLKHMICHK